jgi:hypothetical protein
MGLSFRCSKGLIGKGSLREEHGFRAAQTGPRLTSQPFLPNLRLIRHMHRSPSRVRVLALLLVVIFLGAQFHFCFDLAGGPASSHYCPICSTTALA